jgi:hypothetical protein
MSSYIASTTSASAVPSSNDEIGEPPIRTEAREHTFIGVFAGISSTYILELKGAEAP